MAITIAGPDGKEIDFPDGTDEGTITRAMKQAYPAPTSGWEDAARSFGSGIVKGAVGLGDTIKQGVGMVANQQTGGLLNPVRSMAASALRQYAPGNQVAGYVANELDPQASVAKMLPSQVNSAANYAPKTIAGGYAKTAGEMLPNAAFPGSAAQRVGSVILPTVVSETAGQVAHAVAPQYEGAARTAGAMLGGVASGLAGERVTPAEGSLAANVAQDERAGVTPSLASVGGPAMETLTRFSGGAPLGGFLTRGAINRRTGQIEQSVDRSASEAGVPSDPDIAGGTVKQGLERWATDKSATDSFAGKVNRAYDQVFNAVDSTMRGKQNPRQSSDVTQEIAPGAYTTVGKMTTAGTDISIDNAKSVIGDMMDRNQSEPLKELLLGTGTKNIIDRIQAGAPDMSFQDLRDLRTYVRQLRDNPELSRDVNQGFLAQLEQGLTKDIYSNVETHGSPALAARLQQVDKAYADGQQRISDSLSRVYKAGSNESAYNQVIAGAQGKGAGIQAIQAVKASLRPDEWQGVGSTLISRMGLKNGDFDMGQFSRQYSQLTPSGKQALFGDKAGLIDALDNLNSVIKRQLPLSKVKPSLLQMSGGSLLSLVPGMHMVAGGLAGGALVVGEVLMRPSVVRALAKATSTRIRAGAMSARNAALAGSETNSQDGSGVSIESAATGQPLTEADYRQ
jgi:hypothetical protein